MEYCFISGWGFSNKFTPPIFSNNTNGLIFSSGHLLSSDLESEFKEILNHIKEDSFNLIGWSLGGMLAIHFAHLYPKRIKKLVLISTSYDYIHGLESRHKSLDDLKNSLELFINKDDKKGLIGFYSSLVKEIRLKDFSGCLPSIRELIKQVEILPSKGLYNGLCYLAETNLLKACSEINAKTLILHGSLDQNIPIEHSYDLHNILPKSILHEYESGGHMLPYSHSSLIKKRISNFFKE